jgi:uncharacterized phage protein (TIGR02216 family)
MRLAVRLGLSPEVFWRLSVAEWRALTEADAPERLGRGQLQKLMAAHPDGGSDVRQ